MLPPHLPKPACNIAAHQRWLEIRIIILASFFGLIAGITGATISIAWIWPGYGGGNTWIVSQNRSSSAAALDENISREGADRVFGVYRGASKQNNTEFLAADDKLGDAVAIGSDGWLALAASDKIASENLSRVRAIGSDGEVYGAVKTLYDPYAKILYVKINPSNQNLDNLSVTQFRVASFEESVSPSDDIYIFENNEWRAAVVGEKKHITGDRLDSAPSYNYSLINTAAANTVAMNSRGRVVGFVDADGRLLPSIFVSRVMPTVLSAQKISYPSLGVAGRLSDYEPAIASNTAFSGLMVTNVWNKKSKLQRGDVIMKINGQIVHDESLWYNISGETASLTVWRSGKTLEIIAPIARADALSF